MAKALVRVIYRRLSALVEGEIDQPVVEVQKAGEDDIGSIRCDQRIPSHQYPQIVLFLQLFQPE